MVKLRQGVGAVGRVKARFVHPSEHMRARYPNNIKEMVIDGAKAVRMEQKLVSQRQQLCIIFTHPDFENVELHTVKSHFVVTQEGNPELFFDGTPAGAVNPQPQEDGAPLPPHLEALQERIAGNGLLTTDDEELARTELEVDDDNEPAPENVPDNNSNNNTSIFDAEWGKDDGICNRKKSGATDHSPKFLFGSREVKPTVLQIFESFFFKDFVAGVIIEATNSAMPSDVKPLNYGEFLLWLGLWLIMATVQGPSREEWWSMRNVDVFEGAPYRLNQFMSRTRFDDILANLRFTKSAPPQQRDPFWRVRDMLKAWNENMAANFSPSWICCLDESMSTWINKWTCPGFMFVPRKPWPLGNEYHTISCAISGILFQLELVEGKDAPSWLQVPFQEMGKTVGLLLRLTKSIWSTGRVVILDSGFCVIQGIVELFKKGVFASALIKKRRYWPRYVQGEKIKAHFQNKPVGTVDSWRGTLDGVSFDIFCLKEPDYIMSLMSSYGTNIRVGDEKKRRWKEGGNWTTTTFMYPEVVHNHYKFRHSIDDHNAKRHSPISIEVTWKTKAWENRVFAFLFGVSEVNTMLGATVMMGLPAMPMLDFRKVLARELINNPYITKMSPREKRKRRGASMDGCQLVSLPAHKTWRGSVMTATKDKYPQRLCLCKARKVRTYCPCTPGLVLCISCFRSHVLEE